MPPLPEETDDDQLTPAASKHGVDGVLPSQQPPQQQQHHPQVTVVPVAQPVVPSAQPADTATKLNT